MPDHRRDNSVDPKMAPKLPAQKADPKLEPPIRESNEQLSKDLTDRTLIPIGQDIKKGGPSLE
ncbi:hypothetical protein ASC96_30510 [Rhizobium sp. Root1204]|nr:hypothetical protein ASC96_30510 [Rhizobium sp. Root1204]